MKQLIVDLKTGNTILEEVPAPSVPDGYVLIQNTRSVVSIGTERMLVEFGKAGWIGKARQNRDRVQDVLNKVKTDGLKPTLDAVTRKLGKPIPLGYSSTGTVTGIGKGVTKFVKGDRVASNGGHSEVVAVPQNLVAKVPDTVNDDAAAFTVVGAIALQGIRLLQPTFGETIVVVGLGLIGQCAIQLLKANGCRVIGIDPSDKKRSLAATSCEQTLQPSDDIAAQIQILTGGIGADAVLITASSKSDDIISQAAQMCRKRGRIVLTGVIGLDIHRSDFYEKEISFQVSASYGPGRYDTDYEEKGNDYPIGFVRWTAQRNFEAVLQAMSAGQLNVAELITKRISFDNAPTLYEGLNSEDTLGSVIEYSSLGEHSQTIRFAKNTITASRGVIGIIGAGNFTEAVLLPILKEKKAEVKAIAGASGMNATRLGKKYGISTVSTDYEAIISDPTIDSIIITTRHHLHAPIALAAIAAGKYVLVEKPLAINEDELEAVTSAYKSGCSSLTVGFNRRFAPMAVKMKEALAQCAGPKHIIITCNAGALPANSWILDPVVGGGRLISEGCHFIDLSIFLSGSLITNVSSYGDGSFNILLSFRNGDTAVINYVTSGHKGYDKERVEVYSSGKTLILENWRKLTGYGFNGLTTIKASQDKGHSALITAWLSAIKEGTNAPIPFDEIVNASTATLAADRGLGTALNTIL